MAKPKRCSRRFLVPLLMTIALVACRQTATGPRPQPSDAFERARASGVLRVGYIIAPPWIIKDPSTGRLSGTSIDTMNEIARLANLRVEYIETSWNTFAAGLQSGQYDVSIAPTFATIPRATAVAFTRPQMYVGNSAIVRANDKRFKSVTDLNAAGVVIAVTQGEQGHEYAKANLPKATLRVIPATDQAVTFAEVLAGRADVALGDAWFTAKFAATHPQATDLFADEPYNLTPVAWAVRYGDPQMLAFLNTCIDYLDSIGVLRDFDRRYEAHWLRPRKLWERS